MSEHYKGSIELISGLKQKNNLDFPLMEASAIAFYEEVSQEDGSIEIKEIRLPEKLKSVGVSEKDKAELISTAVTQVLDSDSFKGVQTNVTQQGESIGLIQADIDALERQLAAQAGDNDKLIVHYDKTAQKLYLYEKDDNGDIEFDPGTGSIIKVNLISETTIQGGGSTGTGATYSLSLEVAENTKNYFSVLEGRQTLLPYQVKLWEKVTDPVTGETSLNPIIAEKITYSIYRNDVFQRSITENEIKNGAIDVSDLLILGNNNFKITGSVIEYIDTKNDDGEDITIAHPARATARWTVNVVSLRLELPEVSDSSANIVGWDATPKFGAIPFAYKVVGALPKKMYFILDGDEEHAHIETINAPELSSTYTIPKQTHGIHTLEVYCEGTLNAGTPEEEIIPMDKVKYILMCVDGENTTPIIRVKAAETAEQYSNTIVYFNVYDPLDESANKIEVYENDVLRTTYSNIISNEQTWTYNPQEAGLKTITVKYLDYSESVNINVNEFPYKISAAEGDLMVDFIPRGRSNQDMDYNVFKNNAFTTEEDGTKTEIPMNWTFSDNFDWINGGWQKDAAGDEYFCIKAGTSVNFDYNLFNKEDTVAKKDAYGNYSIAGTGKEFKLIFKTANVARADATWLSCIAPAENGQLTGLEMQAHNAYVKSNFDTLEIPYSEEDIIEFDMNIVPITKFTATYEPELTSKVIPMILTYEDGTPVQPKVITNPATSFKQTNAVPISIGSSYCDVHIYRLKIYERYLSESEILNNFIADARNGEEMSKRFRRNQIYMTGQSSFGGTEQDLMTLAEACPDLRVYLLSAPYFTNHKDDKVKNTTIKQWYYKNGKDSINDIWVATGATHRGQGTSSNEYGYSGRNLDFDMKKATITLGDNKTVVSKISLTPTSVPTNYLNYKTNIASSEHANNSLLAKRFDRYLPYETIASQNGAEKGQDVKNSMEFYNCVVFIQETDPDLSKHREFNDTKIHFYGIGNIGDSKKTDSSRLNDKNDTKEFCVEIMDWNRHLSSFPVNTMMNAMGYTTDEATQEKIYTWAKDENLGILYELIDGQYQLTKDTTVNLNKVYYVDILEHDDFSEDYTYGFRYITEYEVEDASKLEEGETIEGNKQRNEEVQAAARQVWKDFYKFITRDLTTNGKEDPAKVAAWKSEFADWFILDSALYYYLFTLRYTMVDNRAKNSFWHYGKCPDGKYRFEFWDYDNDTALGIDNAGKLEIPFGVEDNDTDAAGAPYFRANNSTFFTRVAKYFTTELNTMWTTVEQNTAKGNAFDSTNFINEFDTWQEQFPEELWRLDYERKYKRTYVGGEGADWDNALPKIVDGKKVVEKRYLTEMMNGRKKYQRRQFERNQDAYMSSKFFGNKNYSNSITLRGSGAFADKAIPADFTLRVIPFNNMYLNLHDGTNYFYHNRVFAGQQYNINLLDSIAKLDLMYIRGASNLQELGDLSLMYLQTATLGAGSKLKTVILGNPATGYSNDSLQTLEVGASNQMLEELDIRNLSNLTSTDLPVTSIPSLKRVYAQGSNILTARFANNGLLEEAYLPATLTQLELRNLYFLNHLELEGYENLIDLTIDNCNIPTEKQIAILNAAINLKSVRMTNVEWHFETTDLLNRLYDCSNGSVLTGYVYVDAMRQTEFDKYAEKWPELEVHYGRMITQYNLNFYNEGASEPFFSYKVDTNTTLYPHLHDPIQNGMLTADQIPTKPNSADGQWSYEFADWSPSINPTTSASGEDVYLTITADQNFFATFAQTKRKYTVTWYGYNRQVLETQQVEYGTAATYTGPTPTRTNQTDAYFLFGGWEQSTAAVTHDIDVTPIWLEANPGKPSTTDSASLHPVEIYSLAEFVKDNDYNNYSHFDSYIGLDDEITVQLGYMPDYENVESIVFEDAMKTYKGLAKDVVVTNQKLFEQNQSFTLAIDFTFHHPSKYGVAEGSNHSLISCITNDGSSTGFSVLGYSNSRTEDKRYTPYLQWKSNAEDINVNHVTSEEKEYREIVVLQYSAADNKLRLYTNDRFSIADVKLKVLEDTINNPVISNIPLSFGGRANAAGSPLSATYATGEIHYAKLWKDDLGEEECKKICSWVYDTISFERVDNSRYYIDNSSRKVTTSFVATKLLDEPMMFNATSQAIGWDESTIRTWLNNKMLKAFAPEWQLILQPTTIYSLSRKNSTAKDKNNPTEIELFNKTDGTSKHFSSVATVDKLYLPALSELHPTLNNDFIASTPSENMINYYMAGDKGTNWRNLSCYPQYLEDKEDLNADNQARIKQYPGVTDNIPIWMTRTPSLTSTKTIATVTQKGQLNHSNYYYDNYDQFKSLSMSSPIGVVLAFSI